MNHNRFCVVAVWVAAIACLAVAAALSVFAAEPAKGLVLHFGFDQAGAEGLVADLSGQNNSGRASEAKWTSTGKQGGGCEFASTGSHIRVSKSTSLNLKQVTVAAWFKTSKSSATWRRIVDKRAERGFALGIGGDAKDLPTRDKLAFVVNGGTPCVSDVAVADGAWHHAAATFDGENLRLYVDGQLQKQVVRRRGQVAANADDLVIGMNVSRPSPQEKGQSLDGVIDDVKIFNRALSPDEIKAMIPAVIPAAAAGTQKFTKQQVAGRLRQLNRLYDEGLLTKEFYDQKVKECEAAE